MKTNKPGFTILISLLTFQTSICQKGDQLFDIGYKSIVFSNDSRVDYLIDMELYPEDLSGYNGLARTLVIQNKHKEAMKVYEAALEKHPNNESIQRKLNRLTTILN